MTREEQIQQECIEDMLQWSADKFYRTFGYFLEKVVNKQKELYQSKLKSIWRNRKWYAFRDTAEQFDNETMLLYFNPKKIKHYSLYELETIIEKFEDEVIHSNPNRSEQ
jgi:hypothetical protein